MVKSILSAIRLIVLIYAGIFCVSNMDSVEVSIIPKFYVINLPLFVPVVAAFILGLLIFVMVYLTDKYRTGKELKSLKNKVQNSEDELVRLNSAIFTESRSQKVEEMPITLESKE
jgi:uncharacterized integral membrane protein